MEMRDLQCLTFATEFDNACAGGGGMWVVHLWGGGLTCSLVQHVHVQQWDPHGWYIKWQ